MSAVLWVILVVALATSFGLAVALARTRRALRALHVDEVVVSEPVVDEPSTGDGRKTEQLALALHASADGVVVVDVDGNLVLRNGPANQFHAARHADLLAEEAMEELLDAARKGEAGQRELKLFGPPRKVLFVRAQPLVHEREIVGAVAFVRNISESRRVEDVRRDFVANVSHELKTPIGALAVLAETISSGGDPTVMQQLAERVVREADRLAHIVDDLLDLSLIEAQENPVREPLPVPLLVGEAVDQVRPAADVAGVPLSILTPIPDVDVSCDRRQLLSAIVNLLENAVKYSDPGAPVEVEVVAERSRVHVSVRDHGIGVPKRDLERIFERFYRVDRARSRQTGGTGLGLAIVRHVAQAHGGEVTVESVEGEGSTFTLTLPFVRRSARVASDAGDDVDRSFRVSGYHEAF
jgi:two-component system sensor histidine kinase SenX3